MNHVTRTQSSREKIFFFSVLEGISVFRWVVLKFWFVSWPPRGLFKNTRVSDLVVLGCCSRICISASSQVIQMLQVQGPHTENHYPSHESGAHFVPCGWGGVMALIASQLHYVKVIDGLNSGFSSSSILHISVSSTFTHWFQIGKGVRQGCILSPCLCNLYTEYIMRNAGLEEAQGGINIARRNINNLR